MTQPRDPRTDPRAGDVLSKTSPKGREIVRRVNQRDGGDVWYYGDGLRALCWITTWKKWAKTATVVSTSGSPGPVAPRS